MTRYRAAALRCHQGFSLDLHPRLNVIVGGNGAGKTSLLEGLFVLSRGRSFRTARLRDLLKRGEARWWVAADHAVDGQFTERCDLQWTPEGIRARVESQEAGVSQLARRLPVQVLESAQHAVVDEGPGFRRAFLDWGVFHVEPDFLAVWRQYARCLQQRNRALASGAADAVVRAFDPELLATGQRLDAARRRQVAGIMKTWPARAEALLGTAELALEYQPGWATESFAAALDAHLPRHRQLGQTSEGPHRAELKLRWQGRDAVRQVSRGQQRLLVTSLILAQADWLMAAAGVTPVLLLDDFSAELSAAFQARLAEGLADYRGQVWVTAFEPPPALQGRDHALFHVEHGAVHRLH
ncbi:MAG TPA: DNA replication and repair protein RecF [Nevskiaceae bacterium]|nr:DNA replication and repair protein RecF [Nevskiaceae bacterium]